MDKIQEKLYQMEQANPSSERAGQFASQLRLNLRERLRSVEAVPQEHSYVAPFGENDYHQEIPDDSPVKRYLLNNDGSLYCVDYKNGGSKYYPKGSKDKLSYLVSLLKARELAEHGNPEFEIYLRDAVQGHYKVWDCHLDERKGRVPEIYGATIKAFEDFYRDPSNQLSDLVKGMPAITSVSGIERVELSEKCDGGAEVIFYDHTIFTLSSDRSTREFTSEYQEIRVIHDNDSGDTMIQRSAKGIPFVRITRKDQNRDFFNAIFSLTNNGTYLLGQALSGQELDYDLLGKPLKRLELLLQDNQ